ncbi:MAG: hypothetical protein CMF22_02060 [Idiomarinaceae bacterium]|uniref:hypothetical protein n=1 Tax=Pseudidiomarina aquimaris TaxID=641841 RepID=UPI000C47D8FA|nr:hypothetical protein [Idiomarinaceae bacterium]|tara:strand:- start:9704 stop:10594 length:891 start_codon:yes stop_codon:yes gene_type:complete
MKNFFACSILAIGALTASAASSAQDTETLTFRADIDYVWWTGTTSTNTDTLDVIDVEIIYSVDTVPDATTPTGVRYVNNIQYIDFLLTDLDAGAYRLTGTWYYYSDDETSMTFESSEGQSITFFGDRGNPDPLTIAIRELEQQIFIENLGYPMIVDGDVAAELFITYFLGGPQTFELLGVTQSLNIESNDTDRDGISDALDQCEASIMDPTVVFKGWYDSGVTNYRDSSGCTVMDHYASCPVEEEAPRRGIRSVRSGPSSCEKAVSYDLVGEGMIDYSEARRLRDALYQSYQQQEF